MHSPLKLVLEMNFSSVNIVFLKFQSEFKLSQWLPHHFHRFLPVCLTPFLFGDEPLVHLRIKRRSKWLFLSVWYAKQTVEVNVTANLQKTCHCGSLTPLPLTSASDSYWQHFWRVMVTFFFSARLIDVLAYILVFKNMCVCLYVHACEAWFSEIWQPPGETCH